jgi:hypothetical protein
VVNWLAVEKSVQSAEGISYRKKVSSNSQGTSSNFKAAGQRQQYPLRKCQEEEIKIMFSSHTYQTFLS